MNIIKAIEDPNLFRPFLTDANDDLTSWDNWQVALRAIYGLPIRARSQRTLMKECTGRTKLRKAGFSTSLLLTGRRSGKSRIAAVCGAFEAALAGHQRMLSKGERGVVFVVSPTRSQSRIVRDYTRAIFEVPLLKAEIADENKNGFELTNGIRIEILAGSYQTVRGFTGIAAVVDEVCFFGYSEESKIKSDTELIRAIRPSLATVSGRLIAISSPYAMKGWAYSQYKRHFGNDDGSTLVWNCPSRTMNPLLSQSIIDEAVAEDPASARAEYYGEFRDDICTFIPREVVEAVVVRGRKELPPVSGCQYAAFVDLSGGRVDDAALAVGHIEGLKVVVDLVRQWKPPFSPDSVVGEMCMVLKRYGLTRVIGDNYSAEFVKNSFNSRGVRYARATTNPWSDNPTAKVAKPKSLLYLELLPRLCSGDIELLDNEVLVNQLSNLERRTRVGGRDTVDHGPGQHDDVANVVAGVCDVAIRKRIVLRPLSENRIDNDPCKLAWRQRQLEDAQREEQRLAAMPSDSFADAVRQGSVKVFGNNNQF